jgi:hypothetical protein
MNDEFGRKFIADLRKKIKADNLERKKEGKQCRYIALRPRLGKDNPNAGLYRSGELNYQMIRVAHASHYDLYLYYL